MATRKKAVKQEQSEAQGLSKEEDEIARFIRFNCKTDQSIFQENEVHYFTGSKAVDTLYESKYGTKAKGEAKFTSRAAAVKYIQGLMDLQLFFRARKLVAKKKSDKNKEKAQGSKKKDEETVTETEAEDKEKEPKTTEKPVSEKKKKKVKLEMHDIQVFNDDKDVYVWVFDPTPLFKKIVGLLMVVGTIVACLFPLWPMWLRQGVYYLSMAGIGLFGLIIVVAILRTLLFGAIWLLSMGKHKLWVLPNLTEDCGFFESFKPFYTYEYCPGGGSIGNAEGQKKSKKKDEEYNAGEQSKPLLEDAGDEIKEKNSSQSENSASDAELTASGSEVSAPPSPAEGAVMKRKVRRADDFVHVRSN